MPVFIEPIKQLDRLTIQQLEKIYINDSDHLDGKDSKHLLNELEMALQQDTTLYLAIFNQRIIGAIWATHQQDNTLLSYLAIHPANYDRGIDERLVREVYRMEKAKGISKINSTSKKITQILDKIG